MFFFRVSVTFNSFIKFIDKNYRFQIKTNKQLYMLEFSHKQKLDTNDFFFFFFSQIWVGDRARYGHGPQRV